MWGNPYSISKIFLDSGILEIFSFGIPESWGLEYSPTNTAQRIWNPTNDWKLVQGLLTNMESSTWNTESSAWIPESKIVLDSLTYGD